MITEEQYQEAVKQKEEAEKVIQQYHKENTMLVKERLENGPAFTDDELIYSAEHLCPCGHGLAYPRNCGAFHYWDCSAILKGIANEAVEHCAKFPFTTTKIKGESERNGTTRGVFKPQKKKE